MHKLCIEMKMDVIASEMNIQAFARRSPIGRNAFCCNYSLNAKRARTHTRTHKIPAFIDSDELVRPSVRYFSEQSDHIKLRVPGKQCDTRFTDIQQIQLSPLANRS